MQLRIFICYLFCLLAGITAPAQPVFKAPARKTNVWTVIDQQPAGTLKTFKRTGKCALMDEKGLVQNYDQTGAVSIVFTSSNEVYILNPISLMEYGSWVRGLLSTDGTTITVPLGQCLDYNESYDAATLLQVFNYYDGYGFEVDEDTKSVTFTIGADGSISLDDTNPFRVLGGMQTSNGVLAEWFNNIWNGKGDFATVYQPEQAAHSDLYPVISEQPQGEESLYERSGNYLFVENNRLFYTSQRGFMHVVRGEGGKVYLKDPVFGAQYGSWIEGTLSDDGKTITVALPQNLYYSQLAGYAVRLGVLKRPDTTFAIDESETQISYTVDGNTIALNDFPEWRKTLTVYRSDTKEYLALGDYATVYTVFDEPQVVTPPEGLVTQTMPVSGLEYVGAASTKLESTVQVGWQGNDVYIQGLLRPLPEAWIKGTLSGREITFPRAYMGKDDVAPYFFAGYTSSGMIDAMAYYDAAENTIMFNGSAEFNSSLSYQDMRIYFNGLFIGNLPDVVTPPASLQTKEAPLHGRTYNGSAWAEVDRTVVLGIDGSDVYVKGLFNEVPDGWIKGTLSGGKATFPTGQYVGKDKDYNTLIYMVGYDDDARQFADPTFSYYADEDVFVSDVTIVANGQKTDWYYSSYFEAGLTIGDEDLLTVTTLPSGAVARTVPLVGTQVQYNNSSGQNEVLPLESTVRIALVGDDEVYIQGLSEHLPTAWVKGKRDARGNVTLTSPQMFGTYELNNTEYKLFLLGVELSQNDYKIVDVKLSYNAMRDTYTLQTPLFVSINKRELVWVQWYQEGSVIGNLREFTSTDFNSYNAATTPLSSGQGADYIGDGDIVENITITDAATGLVLTVTPSGSATPNRFVLDAEKGVQLELNGGTLTASAPAGKAFTQLTLQNSLWNEGNRADRGALNNGLWTGEATRVVFNIAGRTLLDKVLMGDLLAQAITIDATDGTDLTAALNAALQNNPEPTAISICLADGAACTVSGSLQAPVSLTITSSGAATATIDASQLQGEPLVALARGAVVPANELGFHPIDLTIANVTVKNLTQPLVYGNAAKYLVSNLTVDNCIVHASGSSKTLFDFSDGGVVGHLTISHSTLFANPHHSGVLYSSQSGHAPIEAGLSEQVFTITGSTLAGIAYAKNVFTHRQSNQSYLTYEVNQSVILDCGKSGQFLKGLNGGVGGKNPTWRVSGNAFLRTADGSLTDVSANETTGDSDEPATASLTAIPAFANAAEGDFTIPADSEYARLQVGDPRWFGVLVGIQSATTAPADAAPAAFYDLQGRRVQQPAKGLYLQRGANGRSGKKVLF